MPFSDMSSRCSLGSSIRSFLDSLGGLICLVVMEVIMTVIILHLSLCSLFVSIRSFDNTLGLDHYCSDKDRNHSPY